MHKLTYTHRGSAEDGREGVVRLTHSSHPWCHCVHPPWGTVVALLLLPPYQVAAGRAWSSLLVYLICDQVDPHPLGWYPGR